MHFYKVLEYGPGRPSPEQKLRDVNLNFLGCVPGKTSMKYLFFDAAALSIIKNYIIK